MCCLPYLGLLTERTHEHYVQFAKFYRRFESCLKLTTLDVQVLALYYFITVPLLYIAID